MNFSMKSIPIVILLLACVNCVAADFHISGSFIGGILGFIIFILDVIVAIEVIRSSKTQAEKVLWVLFVFFFPIIGLIVYFIFGRSRTYSI